jgi:hypothetical protein
VVRVLRRMQLVLAIGSFRLGATFPLRASLLSEIQQRILSKSVSILNLIHDRQLKMPPKRTAASRGMTPLASDPSYASVPSTPTPAPPTGRSSSKASSSSFPAQDILQDLWQRYVDTTPQRAKLIDTFMAFLVVVGVVQFAYCVVAGNYVRLPSWHNRPSL